MSIKEAIEKIGDLLPGAVLLPVPHGQKRCMIRGWSKTTFEQSRSPEWRRMLLKFGNIGVLMGAGSGHIVSQDLDSDEALDAFLLLNPGLRKSVISRGARGGNVWMRMSEPEYPGIITYGHFGEFRSNRAQTIIWGIHPSGVPYRFLNEGPLVELPYSDIRYPDRFKAKRRSRIAGAPARPEQGEGGGGRDSPSSSTIYMTLPSSPLNASSCLHVTTDPSLPDKPPDPDKVRRMVERVRAGRQFEAANPALDRIIKSRIASQLPLKAGSRNSILTREIAPRLFTAVARPAALTILERLISTGLTGDYEEAFEKFNVAFSNLERSYRAKLTDVQGAMFDAVGNGNTDPISQAAFRIFFSLAYCKSGCSPPEFFLSCTNLAARLGWIKGGKTDDKRASRLFADFLDCEILSKVSAGTPHSSGKKGEAAHFRWLLGRPLFLETDFRKEAVEADGANDQQHAGPG